MKIYVGNLSFETKDADLSGAFAPHGTVQSAKVVTDRETGQSRGFGFVEMGDAEAKTAIDAMNGFELKGRALKVNEAKPREPGAGGFRPKRF
jgi:RNA recognition motif-containing protein